MVLLRTTLLVHWLYWMKPQDQCQTLSFHRQTKWLNLQPSIAYDISMQYIQHIQSKNASTLKTIHSYNSPTCAKTNRTRKHSLGVNLRLDSPILLYKEFWSILDPENGACTCWSRADKINEKPLRKWNELIIYIILLQSDWFSFNNFQKFHIKVHPQLSEWSSTWADRWTNMGVQGGPTPKTHNTFGPTNNWPVCIGKLVKLVPSDVRF